MKTTTLFAMVSFLALAATSGCTSYAYSAGEAQPATPSSEAKLASAKPHRQTSITAGGLTTSEGLQGIILADGQAAVYHAEGRMIESYAEAQAEWTKQAAGAYGPANGQSKEILAKVTKIEKQQGVFYGTLTSAAKAEAEAPKADDKPEPKTDDKAPKAEAKIEAKAEKAPDGPPTAEELLRKQLESMKR